MVKLHVLAEYRPIGRAEGHILTAVGRVIYNENIERTLAEALGPSLIPAPMSS